MRSEPVFICSWCGRGFLRHPGALDPEPTWFTSFSRSDGPCAGPVVTAQPAMLIRNIDRQMEQLNVKNGPKD